MYLGRPPIKGLSNKINFRFSPLISFTIITSLTFSFTVNVGVCFELLLGEIILELELDLILCSYMPSCTSAFATLSFFCWKSNQTIKLKQQNSVFSLFLLSNFGLILLTLYVLYSFYSINLHISPHFLMEPTCPFSSIRKSCLRDSSDLQLSHPLVH